VSARLVYEFKTFKYGHQKSCWGRNPNGYIIYIYAYISTHQYRLILYLILYVLPIAYTHTHTHIYIYMFIWMLPHIVYTVYYNSIPLKLITIPCTIHVYFIHHHHVRAARKHVYYPPVETIVKSYRLWFPVYIYIYICHSTYMWLCQLNRTRGYFGRLLDTQYYYNVYYYYFNLTCFIIMWIF